MPECFVIMPLTTPLDAVERYGDDPDHFAHVLEHLFVPAIEAAGFTAKRPIAEGSDLIHAEIVRNLETADMVLCDISALNANVFFEFGIRTALDRPICLVGDEHTKLPFDVGGINCHAYASGMKAWELKADVERLTKHLSLAAKRKDSALWRHFGLTQRANEAADGIVEGVDGSRYELILERLDRLQRAEPAPGSSSFEHRARQQAERAAMEPFSVLTTGTRARFVSNRPFPELLRMRLEVLAEDEGLHAEFVDTHDQAS